MEGLDIQVPWLRNELATRSALPQQKDEILYHAGRVSYGYL